MAKPNDAIMTREATDDVGVSLTLREASELYDRLTEKQADAGDNSVVVNGRHLDAFFVNKPA